MIIKAMEANPIRSRFFRKTRKRWGGPFLSYSLFNRIEVEQLPPENTGKDISNARETSNKTLSEKLAIKVTTARIVFIFKKALNSGGVPFKHLDMNIKQCFDKIEVTHA